MKKLGISAYDQAGNFKGVTKVLEELNQKTSGLDDELRDTYMSMIGGKTQIDTLNALMAGLNATTQDGQIEFYALRKELENSKGSLNEMADAVNNTMAGAMARLNSALDDLKINAVKIFEPIITPAINKAAETIPKMTNNLVDTINSVKNLGSAFKSGLQNMSSDGVVKAFYPMLEQANVTLPKIFGKKIGTSLANSIAKAMSKTQFLSPNMSLIENSAKYTVSNFSKGFKKFLQGESLTDAFKESISGLDGVINVIFNSLNGNSKIVKLPIVDSINDSIQRVSNFVEKIKSGFNEIGTAYSESFGEAISKISPALSTISGSIGNIQIDKISIVTDVFNAIKDVVVEAAPLISQAIIIVVQTLSQLADGSSSIINLVLPVLDAAINAFNILADAALNVASFILDNWSSISPIIYGVGAAIGTVKMVKFALDVGKATKAFTLLSIAKVKDKTETLILQGLYIKDAIVKGASTAATWAQTAAITAWNGVCAISTAATSALGAAFTFLTSPIGIVILVIGALIGIGILLYKNWDDIKNGALSLWSNLTNTFNNIKDNILNAVNSLAEKFPFAFDIISSYIGSWIETIQGVIENIKVIFTNIIEFIRNVFTGDWEAAWENVKTIFSNAFEALKDLALAPLNAILSVVNSLIDKINGINIKVPDWVPGFGGKEFDLNIPQIPKFAKGTNYSPDTFIAGEKGPELITNHKGSKVFTAFETENVIRNLMPNVGIEKGFSNLIPNEETKALVKSRIVKSDAKNNSASTPININFNPQITIEGNTNSDILQQLYNQLKMSEERLRQYILEVINSDSTLRERRSYE